MIRATRPASLLSTAMHPALRFVDHRPWPVPNGPWLLRMGWLDLAFIHYPVPAEWVRPRLPAGLQLDEFDGQAWIGLVPFRMADVRPRLLPAVPGLSTFPEVNVRTYVIAGGKPGVWFFSLDADSRITVQGGRRLLGLPYHQARINLTSQNSWLECTSLRHAAPAVFRGRYRPRGDVFFAEPGSFAHWASERYCLYSFSQAAGLSRVEVHHLPWPLQTVEVQIAENTLFAAAGLPMPKAAPIGHFSAGVDVVSYGKEQL